MNTTKKIMLCALIALVYGCSSFDVEQKAAAPGFFYSSVQAPVDIAGGPRIAMMCLFKGDIEGAVATLVDCVDAAGAGTLQTSMPSALAVAGSVYTTHERMDGMKKVAKYRYKGQVYAADTGERIAVDNNETRIRLGELGIEAAAAGASIINQDNVGNTYLVPTVQNLNDVDGGTGVGYGGTGGNAGSTSIVDHDSEQNIRVSGNSCDDDLFGGGCQ